MDDEHLQEIFEYFKNQAKPDNVGDALNDLGDDEYTEIEIRLVRLKFLSEMGD